MKNQHIARDASADQQIRIVYDYVRYLFTPEDSGEDASNTAFARENRYLGAGKALFWFGMSVLLSFVISGSF